MVRFIEQKVYRFNISETGASAWVEIRVSAAGNNYVQTRVDGVWKDNLFGLKKFN